MNNSKLFLMVMLSFTIASACAPSRGPALLDLPHGDFCYSFTEEPFVHPAIIEDLISWISDDGDQVVAINLLDSQNSNRYFGEIEVEQDQAEHAYPTVIWHSEDGSFRYRYIGAFATGLHLLLTSSWTGGTGHFVSLLFVRIIEDFGLSTDWEKDSFCFNRRRLLLQKLGEIKLGDRWRGEIKLTENELHLETIIESCARGKVVKKRAFSVK